RSSEPETQAVQNYLESVFQRQRPGGGQNDPAPADAEGVFISLHSFGELVLLPWEDLGGQNENNAPNHNALTVLGRRFGFLTDYAVGRWQLLPPAGGTMTDFAYAEFGVAAYTFEVGTTFMQSCDRFEARIWPDNFQALKLAAKSARRPYLEPAGPAITALNVTLKDGHIRISGTADDTRYFRGNVTEPPTDDPIAEVVEIRITPGLPESAGGKPLVFALDPPASIASFEFVLPDGVT
ncbi:MAG: M14 family zinc carboxypeptidase, partial [Wenzhouxiangellaceae bacterium]